MAETCTQFKPHHSVPQKGFPVEADKPFAKLHLCIQLQEQLRRRVDFFKAAAVTALAAISGAITSVCIDSLLWQRWLWPEFEVLWFNTAENKSGEWGTLPPLWHLRQGRSVVYVFLGCLSSLIIIGNNLFPEALMQLLFAYDS